MVEQLYRDKLKTSQLLWCKGDAIYYDEYLVYAIRLFLKSPIKSRKLIAQLKRIC